jgi:hypothetical protein
MAYADIERLGRELNGSMFFGCGYGQDPTPHRHYIASDSSNCLMEEVEMGMESLAVSLMDDFDWSRLLPPASPCKSPSSSASLPEPEPFSFEDWASRLIGTPGVAMDLDGMKCSAVASSPQQPCKALR